MKLYHYTYWLTDLNTNMHYIGCRTSNVPPIQDKYFSSSKKIKQLIVEGHQFDKKVLAIWPSRTDAITHEILLHDIFNVGINPQFLNKSKQTSTGFDTSGNKFPGKGIGRKDSIEAKLHKSLSAGKHLKNKKLTDHHKLRISKSMQSIIGHPQSSDTRIKLSMMKKNKPLPKLVCRIFDKKEMDIANFSKWNKNNE